MISWLQFARLSGALTACFFAMAVVTALFGVLMEDPETMLDYYAPLAVTTAVSAGVTAIAVLVSFVQLFIQPEATA